MRRYCLLVIALTIVAIVAACTQTAPTPTLQPPPAEPLAPTTEPLPAALTAGELAVRGRRVYSRSCAKCHDEAFAGSLDNALNRFADASAMFGYMRDTMPQDRPGSLEFDDYFAVLAMVLVNANVVAQNAVLDANALADIKF